ncbi:hypothetical protein PF005_g111 [Phytophthora fragariae]|uniref:Uncharacterized protein n=2 Tax=Phytophthora fragariae TaxID=53985 RepID=A0A6A3FW04_9STRA|nr:hypothetical protein PF003_g32485 [Phytophthora fragariae]KAE8950405.1 hypothetical protein PF009_g111 [Phytophthora fragariae]KAE9031463.1 hypothetical protein PF011_g102 [Phytophthora fragariae]KAE9140852.1 hypothetical protein PF010_g24 [Phytophthora fragariae]KAE9141744.1 hypothetical protein PF007_g47 [Phytophthora fragariae]
MELLEDAYEDELIDAFDAPEPEALAPTKRPSPSPLPTGQNLGQPTRPRVQEFQAKTTLYPTFDDTDKTLPAPPVVETAPSETVEQLDSSETTGALHDEPPLPAEVYHEDDLMSTEELQRRRLKVEREMQVYQERFDRVAQALAGETPHQIEERRKREEERLERQEKRHEAVETRLQHQIERLEEREERRARIQARHHRASRSPSPSCGRHRKSEPADDARLSQEEEE